MTMFCVKKSEFGNGLFAKSSIQPFDVISTELPIVSILTQSKLSDYCDYCWKKVGNLKVCSKCKSARFCSIDCQRKSWNFSIHKGECSVLSRMATNRDDNDTLRVCLRFLFRKQYKDFDATKQSQFDIERLKDLAYEPSQDDQYYKELAVVVLNHLKNCFPTFKLEVNDVVKTMLMMKTNCMRIPKGEDGSELGVGLYNIASFANHSCSPNMIVMFCGNSLEYVATKEIKEGEQLFISYIDNRIPKCLRRFMLFENWNFVCSCFCCENEEPSNVETIWELYKTVGESATYCTDKKKEKYLEYCEKYEKNDVVANDDDLKVIEFAKKCSESSVSSNFPGLRFSELVYNFSKDKLRKGYFSECLLHRYALQCVSINPMIKEEKELRSNLKRCYELNESFVKEVEMTNEKVPMFLGKHLAMTKCLLWEVSYQLEYERDKVEFSKLQTVFERTKQLIEKLFNQTRLCYSMQEDFTDIQEQYRDARMAYDQMKSFMKF